MLRGALLGAGNIARAGHLPSYRRAGKLAIVAAADPCPENLAALRETLPGVRTYGDARALLDQEQPEFVDICAPPFAHTALIELALERGCHVLCEKPVTTDFEEALRLRRRIEAHDCVVMPCHQYHYAPQWLEVRRLLAGGEIGTVHEGVVTVQRTGANAGTPAWRPSWRTEQALAGGGIVVDHGAHLFYQLIAHFGEPETIACVTERRLPGHDVDDTATVTLRFAAAAIRLVLTWAAESRSSSHRYHGSRGEVRLLDDRIEVVGAAGTRTIRFESGLSTGSAHADWFAPLLDELAARIERHDYRLDRFDEAVAVAACITLAYESAALGGVPLPWHCPLPQRDLVGLFAAD